MPYFGWVRRRRLEYAEATYQSPVWVAYVHPRLILIEAVKREFPNMTQIVIEDDRSN